MIKKNVVVVGGGNGGAISLVALKPLIKKINLSAVISASDSGGSSGRLRKELDTLPPGDVMRAVLSLSRYEYPLLKKIFFGNRFSGLGKLHDHNLGNLFLTLSAKYNRNDFAASVHALAQSVEAVGQVFPSTLGKSDLQAELSDGTIIESETKIDIPTYDRSLKIKKVWLAPKVKANPEAMRALTQADYIVFGPGDIYTSIIAAILPEGIKRAIGRSKAKLIYVTGNAIHAAGETGPEIYSEMITAIENYLPRPFDFMIYNNHTLSAVEKKYYQKRKWKPFLFDKGNLVGRKIFGYDYERSGGGLCSEKLSKYIKKHIV